MHLVSRTRNSKYFLRSFPTCRFGVPAAWQPGDVALVCNYRWAHGRPQVELRPGEERKIGVMIGAPIQRVGQKEGKW